MELRGSGLKALKKLKSKAEEAWEEREVSRKTKFAEEKGAEEEARRAEKHAWATEKVRLARQRGIKRAQSSGISGKLSSFGESFQNFYKSGKEYGFPNIASGMGYDTREHPKVIYRNRPRRHSHKRYRKERREQSNRFTSPLLNW